MLWTLLHSGLQFKHISAKTLYNHQKKILLGRKIKQKQAWRVKFHTYATWLEFNIAGTTMISIMLVMVKHTKLIYIATTPEKTLIAIITFTLHAKYILTHTKCFHKEVSKRLNWLRRQRLQRPIDSYSCECRYYWLIKVKLHVDFLIRSWKFHNGVFHDESFIILALVWWQLIDVTLCRVRRLILIQCCSM